MNLGKKISVNWGKILCVLLGHTSTTICLRCGKFVDMKGVKQSFWKRFVNYLRKIKAEKEFKGSLRIVPGMKKYAINLLTNELTLLNVETDFDFVYDNQGNKVLDTEGNEVQEVKQIKAEYNPAMMYIDAINDTNAIRKTNNFLRYVKSGVLVNKVSK